MLENTKHYEMKRKSNSLFYSMKSTLFILALLIVGLSSCAEKSSCDCWGEIANKYEKARKNNYEGFKNSDAWTSECKNVIRSKENRDEYAKIMEFQMTGKGDLCDGGKKFVYESNKFQIFEANKQMKEQAKIVAHSHSLPNLSGPLELSEDEMKDAEQIIIRRFDSLLYNAGYNSDSYESYSAYDPFVEGKIHLSGVSWHNPDSDRMYYYIIRNDESIILKEKYMGYTDFVTGTGTGTFDGKNLIINYTGMFGTGKLTLKVVDFELEGKFYNYETGKSRKIELMVGG